MIKPIIPLLIFVVGLISSTSTFAAQVVMKGVRVWSKQESTRVVFELSGKPQIDSLELENPNRYVVDLKNTQCQLVINPKVFNKSPITDFRHSTRQTKDCRLVFELNAKLPANSFVLQPNDSEGFRLVIDIGDSVGLFEVDETEIEKEPPKTAEKPLQVPEPKIAEDIKKEVMSALPKTPKKILRAGTRPFIIAIDPGHGGQDSGAVGRKYKTYEKEVVLAVAKKLRALINQESHMKAFLTRDGDYFITLRKRINMAREMGADIFVSLHADSQPNGQNAKGASVYVLSDKGASSEAARWLADRENKADWIGGTKLEDKNPTLASVLLDLSQTISQESSEELGDNVLSALGKFASLHKKNIEKAAFVVLKSPDIPSILVELEFLSNHDGELRLRQGDYQQKLAEGVFSGLRDYFSKRSLPPAHPHGQGLPSGLDVASAK